jgi:hypothetical protein
VPGAQQAELGQFGQQADGQPEQGRLEHKAPADALRVRQQAHRPPDIPGALQYSGRHFVTRKSPAVPAARNAAGRLGFFYGNQGYDRLFDQSCRWMAGARLGGYPLVAHLTQILPLWWQRSDHECRETKRNTRNGIRLSQRALAYPGGALVTLDQPIVFFALFRAIRGPNPCHY